MTQGPQNPRTDFVVGKNPRPNKGRLFLREAWLKLRVPLLVLLMLVLAAWCAFLYTADKRSTRQRLADATPERIEELRKRSVDLEMAFEKVRQERFELKEEDLLILEQALQAQEEYIIARQAVGTDSQRLDSLRRRVHLLRSERLRRESEEEEKNALTLAKKDIPAAIGLLRRALECEQEISAKWDAAGLGDPGRQARLDTRLRRLESEAIWNKGRALEAEGEKLLSSGLFDEAAAKFAAAMDQETEFLARYRDVRDTEFGRSEKLSDRRETAFSGSLWATVKKQQNFAQAAVAGGNWEKAAQEWQAATDAFGRLLTEYPQSAYADRNEEARLARQLNFARFHKEIAAAREGISKMRADLRQRHVDAAIRQANEWLEVGRKLAEANTGVFLPADAERMELEYLTANEAVVRTLLPMADQNLLPVPQQGVRMYRTEIPQGLYSSLMGANPSSTRREANPVESVTYAEAIAFCDRLGWLLGSKVRLPTAPEFTAAVGAAAQAPVSRQVWSSENTDGVSARPVGTSSPNLHGFHDLLGNVEEWLQADSQSEKAGVIGGSVASPVTPGIPLKTLFKREKMRTLGFRIIVE